MDANSKLHSIQTGHWQTLGATYDGDGTNFALFSAHAERVELCLFDDTGKIETALLHPAQNGAADILVEGGAHESASSHTGWSCHELSGRSAPSSRHRANGSRNS